VRISGPVLVSLWLIGVFAADLFVKRIVLARPDANRAMRRPSNPIGPVASGRTIAGRLGVSPIVQCAAWAICLLVIVLGTTHAGLVASPVSRSAVGAALGGGAGNLFDALTRGGVVDYLSIGPWPMFNLADMAIVAGVFVAVAAR
jgi:hypothetical protein